MEINGRTYRLVINRRAYELAAKSAGRPHAEVIRRARTGSVTAIVTLWWAVLQAEQPEIDLNAAADLLSLGMDDVLDAIVAMMPAQGTVQ